VRANGQLQIAWADVVNRAPFHVAIRQGLTGISDIADVAFGLLNALPLGREVQNPREVGSRSE
jgi:hypothetical protein